MLTYNLEERGNVPLYEYLYRRIREDVLSGALEGGARLPSKRSLAAHLQVSVITVENAYAQLEAEGYLQTRPRRGFYVAQIDRPPAPHTVPDPPPPESSQKEWRLDLLRTEVDRFPASVWAKLTRQVLSEGGLLAPTPHQGLPALREAIARDLRDFKGMSASPEQIVVGAGAEYLYLLLAQLLGNRSGNAVFALEDPGYPKIRQVYGQWGAVWKPLPLDAEGVSLSALRESGADVLHISPAHHYPTGTVTTIARRQALLRWAEETGGVIIEDDYDSELRFSGRPIPTLQSIDVHGRVIYVNSFSQTISPSLRMAFMVLPRRLLERWHRELGFYACTVPALEQQVLTRFLSGGWYEKHLARLRKEYRTRRAAVLEAFRAGPLADRTAILERGAGLHFLLRLDTREDDETLRRRAEGMGVRLGFLSDYAARPGAACAHTLVVNYAALDPALLNNAMELLAKVLFPER